MEYYNGSQWVTGIPHWSPGQPPPTVRFSSPQDFVAYADSLGSSASPGTRRDADQIRQNPAAYAMQGGQPVLKPGWLQRNIDWVGPAAVTGGALAAMASGPAAIASTAAAPSAAAPAAAAPAVAGGFLPVGGSSAALFAAPPAAAPVASTGFGASLLHGLSSPAGQQAISTGGQVASNLIAANAAGKASAAQLQATREALAYEKEQKAKYDEQMVPYLQQGRDALIVNNSFPSTPQTVTADMVRQWGGGPSAGPVRAAAPPQQSSAPPSPAPPSLASMASQSGGAMVTMQAPNGSTRQIPQSDVQHWLAQGARLVGQA